MTIEQCEKCQYFCIEYHKIMDWSYQVCKNPKCIEAKGSPSGCKIEYIKKCPMGNYDPIGPGHFRVISPLDAAFGFN